MEVEDGRKDKEERIVASSRTRLIGIWSKNSKDASMRNRQGA